MTDKTVERHISKPALEKLLRQADICATTCGEARQALGEKMEKAEHLNRWAFRIVRQLWKQDPAKCAHNIRALMLYIDLLGLAAQEDLEDAIADLEPPTPGNITMIGKAVREAGL